MPVHHLLDRFTLRLFLSLHSQSVGVLERGATRREQVSPRPWSTAGELRTYVDRVEGLVSGGELLADSVDDEEEFLHLLGGRFSSFPVVLVSRNLDSLQQLLLPRRVERAELVLPRSSNDSVPSTIDERPS
jgi:hypothetical protein